MRPGGRFTGRERREPRLGYRWLVGYRPEEETIVPTENAETLAAGWIEAWIRMDLDWLRGHLAPDFVHVSPFGRFDDRESYLAAVEPMARKSVADLKILDVVGRGDKAVIRFENVTPKGGVETCDWVRVDGDVIREIRSFYDSAKIREVLSPDEQETLDGSCGDSQAERSPAQGAVPASYSRVCPYLNYEDTGAMIDWLAEAFGLVERHRESDGETVTHAEMTLGDAVIMMGCPGPEYRNPRSLGQVTQSLYVFVDDIDAHCDRARRAGAEILEEPADRDYGHRRYGAVDPEGHRWYFASGT